MIIVYHGVFMGKKAKIKRQRKEQNFPISPKPKMLSPEQRVYLDFLIKLLTSLETAGDSELISPLLAKNIDKLDENFRQALIIYAQEMRCAVADPTVALKAVLMAKLSRLFQNFAFGNRATNLEIAITGYQLVLPFFKGLPEYFFSALINLGNAFMDRINEDKAQNIEQAILYLLEALKVADKDTFPVQWAMIKSHLGNAYSLRLNGDKADNMEMAIAYFKDSLQVRTFEAFPVDWAMTQHNLGLAYGNRLKGDKSDNIELALSAFQDSLKVYNQRCYPSYWAELQSLLAFVYLLRIEGDKADNIEQAIICFQNSLDVYTFRGYPQEWAMIQNNLGNTYLQRLKGDKSENFDRATVCYLQSLTVFTVDAFPLFYAANLLNLAIVYYHRPDSSEEQALAYYQEAAKFLNLKPFPQALFFDNLNNISNSDISSEEETTISYFEYVDFLLESLDKLVGLTSPDPDAVYPFFEQNLRLIDDNLPQVFDFWAKEFISTIDQDFVFVFAARISFFSTLIQDFPQGNLATNIEIALVGFQIVLTLINRQSFPLQWSSTQQALGAVYYVRLRGDRAENLDLAIAAFQQALKVDLDDADFAQSHLNLAQVYISRISGDKSDNLELAIASYNHALKFYTFNDHPKIWAKIQHYLGSTHFDLPKGDKADNIEKAIIALENALKVRTRSDFPEDFAVTMFFLADTYNHRIKGDKADNLEQAILCYQEVLKVYTLEENTQIWATIQYELCLLYSKRIKGNKLYNVWQTALHYSYACLVRSYPMPNFLVSEQ